MDKRNVLLAGVPRSGTTLTCELLNLLPDTVALDEPMDTRILTGELQGGQESEAEQPPDQFIVCDEIERVLGRVRETIATRKRAPSQVVGGRVFGGKFADDSERSSLASTGEIAVEKDLSPGFLLVFKHTGAFTALLETLAQRFRVYAVIRNPLSVLSSWQTISFPCRDGHHPVAEQIDLGLGATLAGIDDRFNRQFHLLAWFYEKYLAVLSEAQVIRYESIVQSGGRALSGITDDAAALDEPLESRNQAAVYDRGAMRRLGERLLETEGAYWEFYARESVQELLDAA